MSAQVFVFTKPPNAVLHKPGRLVAVQARVGVRLTVAHIRDVIEPRVLATIRQLCCRVDGLFAAVRPSAKPFRARSRRRDGEGGAIGAWGGAFEKGVLVGVDGGGVFNGKKSKLIGLIKTVNTKYSIDFTTSLLSVFKK